jgi:hypothetical protein
MKKLLRGILNISTFIVIAYTSYLLILLSLPYIHFERDVEFLETKQLIYHIKPWKYSFYIHVFFSPVVIISGLFQFNRWLITNRPKIHRILGYVYITTVLLISAPSALVMSFYANGGRVAQISFVTLTLCWILFTWIAFQRAKKGNYTSHVQWMLRSYALTLSAVTLRFYAYLFDFFNVNIPPRETYILISYLSWIPNLLFVQLLIQLKYVKYLLLKTKHS